MNASPFETNGSPSLQDFNEALKDPVKFAAAMKEQYRQIADDASGKVPPEERELARRAVETELPVDKIVVLQLKVEQWVALEKLPPGALSLEEALNESARVLNGIVDAGLDLPEPHRTLLLRERVPVRNLAQDNAKEGCLDPDAS